MSFRKSVVMANVIVFSSIAIILTSAHAEFSYPILTYLKFDFAEIPVMIVLMIFGLIPSLITETVHWLALTATRGDWLGPLMKFLAVIPMIIGFWLGNEIYGRLKRKKGKYNFTFALTFGMILGILLRVLVCTIVNVVVLSFVAPYYLDYAKSLLNAAGISASSAFDVMMWVLLFTGIFNTLHVPFSSILATIIVRGAVARMPAIAEKSWFLGVYLTKSKELISTFTSQQPR